MKWLLLLLAFCWPLAVAAQDTPANQARAAADRLAEASARLAASGDARDRVAELTRTIADFEAGLSALRSGLRQASASRAQLSMRLQSRDAEIAGFLAALMTLDGNASPVVLAHPGGPTGAARAGMLLADLVPALDAEVADLRRDLRALRALEDVQSDANAQLTDAMADMRAAREALNAAIAERRPLPKSFEQDPVNEAILLSAAQSLEEFAANLDRLSGTVIPERPDDLSAVKGAIALPAEGYVLRRFQEPDAAGVTRDGLLIATNSSALVTTPVAATLRYAGPLLDLGMVVILEPQADLLFVFAGLDRLYVETGDLVEAGAPLGLMGDAIEKSARETSTDGDQAGASRTEALYIEARENNRPVDPSQWFRTK